MIYIHIPYCRSFCTYCDFYSELPKCGFDSFVKALCAEIEYRSECIPTGHDTLYIGGGTPSVLPLAALNQILSALATASEGREPRFAECEGKCSPPASCPSPASSAGTARFTEFTIEVNPDDIVRGGMDYIKGLVSLGVNRVSMGVQSLDDKVLKWMNRRHDAATARKAYRMLVEGGIDNISVDLIFGWNPTNFPHLGQDFWERTLDDILDIGGNGIPPKHISAYQLSIEDGSALAAMLDDGRYVEAPQDFCADQYAVLCRKLAAAGYHHYEISNFAMPGHEAKHNSAYWSHVPYIGFGPAAHSLLVSPPCHPAATQYIRQWNVSDIGAYIAAAHSGDWDSIVESEELTAEQVAEEKIMLSLRTSTGIDRGTLEACCSDPSQIDRLLASGSLCPVTHSPLVSPPCHPELVYDLSIPEGQEPRLRIPESRFFICDSIISDLI